MAKKKTPANVFFIISGLLFLFFISELPKNIALIRDGDGSNPETQAEIFIVALLLITIIVLFYKGIKRSSEPNEEP